jgi:hypothetical protein
LQRAELEAAWLELTRQTMPAVAKERAWPVRFDHCFQRILLDNAAGQVWYDVVEGRPAYRHAPEELLSDALKLGHAVMAGTEDLSALNRRSLDLRGKR